MVRWSGVFQVSLSPDSRSPFYKIAASLFMNPSRKSPLAVPAANAIFFSGDRVRGTRNPLIERLSDARNIAETLISKLGASVNVFVVEAAVFNGPFAVYEEFIPSVNSRGEPSCYDPNGFPASNSTVCLISKCIEEARKVFGGEQDLCHANAHPMPSVSCIPIPKTIVIGFSKGGTVVNQLLAEFAHAKVATLEAGEENQIFPTSKERFLRSISDFHYVDVGLNSPGAYLNDESVIKKVSEIVSGNSDGIHISLHGTPRQWCDSCRPWIRNEKERLVQLLEACTSGGKLKLRERFYFGNRTPDLQMHFEIIDKLDMAFC